MTKSDYVLVPSAEAAQVVIDALRARLAAVERERDHQLHTAVTWKARATAAEAELRRFRESPGR